MNCWECPNAETEWAIQFDPRMGDLFQQPRSVYCLKKDRRAWRKGTPQWCPLEKPPAKQRAALRLEIP